MLPTLKTTEAATPGSKLSVLQIAITVIAAWSTYALGVHLTLNAQLANSAVNSIWFADNAEFSTGLSSAGTTDVNRQQETRLTENWIAPAPTETTLRR